MRTLLQAKRLCAAALIAGAVFQGAAAADGQPKLETLLDTETTNLGQPIRYPVAGAAQLCSVHFTMTPNGIAAEDKIAVVKRLGRSPDKADAVVMAWYRGVSGGYQPRLGSNRPPPKVIRHREVRKRRFWR